MRRVSADFERIDSETLLEGKIATVRRDRFRYDDGAEADREIVAHPGAVGVVAHDDEVLYLVRQPREAIGVPDLLEIPAGKLDVDGEPPEETGRRELAEEIGKGADHWEHLKTYWSSAGFTDEQVHVFLATGLHDVDQPAVEEDERIELVTWPLDDLDALIDTVTDAKTLIGLLELRRRRSS
jgi:8-oxo-dGTP pyrophosphatase MutT (NUDIX family)